ncbi:MAG: enoyl-CoA hydratase/isomerase family protein [Bacteroidetes bacterium]|nr:enoyl-CoA hydratase/isomerase family protein [Bacteroidota bacterium]
MQNGKVESKTENGIAMISFFHPQSNSLPGEILRKLANEITSAGNNPEAKVIILRSESPTPSLPVREGASTANPSRREGFRMGLTFCAGASFDELISIKNFEEGKKFFSGFSFVINEIRKAPKFVIARVQGKAVGGGVGLAAAADYTLAVKDASVRLSELALGIGPFVVGPAVERKVGASAFTALTINPGEWKSADWAREKGLYADILPSVEDLDKAVSELAIKLSQSSSEAMAQLKKVMWEGTENWDTLLVERAEMSGRLVLSEYTKKYIEKFKSKS